MPLTRRRGQDGGRVTAWFRGNIAVIIVLVIKMICPNRRGRHGFSYFSNGRTNETYFSYKDMTHDIQTTQQGGQQGEIILYQPDETVRLEVRLEDDTVWLTQQQMAELFQTTKNNVTLHIGNVYKEHELVAESTSKESLLVRMEGKRQVTRQRKLYNLDVIISEANAFLHLN